MMDITVEVTSFDIRESEGFEGVYDKCPIVRSLKRSGFTNLEVDSTRILLTTEGMGLKYKVPIPAQIFIEDFDNNKKVKPITFEVKDPQLAQADDYFRNRPICK